MKKTWMFLFVCLCFVLTLPITAPAEVINLTLSDQNPEMSWGSVQALYPWAKQVEAAAKGKVKIKVYPSQTLAKGKDNWNAVKNGIADIGWCFHGYWPGMTSLADVITLPALPIDTAEESSTVLWKLYQKYPTMREQFKDNHVLLLYTTTPYMLITTKKQVKTLEDIKGLKIRMPGGPATDQMKALGGIPVSIPMPDNYISLQKGVIDGMGVPWEALEGFRLYEVVKYYTDTPFPAFYFSIAMNKKKWNGLPKDVQDAFTSVSGLKGSQFWGHNYFDTAKAGAYEKAAKAGFKIDLYQLPATEKARWLEVGGKPMWKQWLSKMEKEGRPEAKQILDDALEMLK
ncbi:MAG: TRAP transporter substrate-binding protein [Pseudomonadota bacterium]